MSFFILEVSKKFICNWLLRTCKVPPAAVLGWGTWTSRLLLRKFGFPWVDSEVVFSKLGLYFQLFVVVWSNLKLHPGAGTWRKGLSPGGWSLWFHLRPVPNSTVESKYHLYLHGTWVWKWVSCFQKYRESKKSVWIVCLKKKKKNRCFPLILWVFLCLGN